MTCPQCWRVFPDNRELCPFCDVSLIERENHTDGPTASQLQAVQASKAGAPPRRSFNLGAIINLVLGVIAVAYALITYSNDTAKYFGGYTYRAPLTNHEVLVIILGVGGVVFILLGLIQLAVKGK